MVKKRSEKNLREVKKLNFSLAIFNKIKEGKSPADMCREWKISKNKLKYYTDFLKKQNIIGKHKNGDWYVKVKSFPLGTRDDFFTKPKTNLHALQISMPIISGKIDDSKWEIKEKLKNWTPKYKQLDIFDGITIKNNNNKSLTIFPHSRNIESVEEIDKLAYEIRDSLYIYFKSKGVILDVENTTIKNLDIGTEDLRGQESGMLKKGEKFTLDLDRYAEITFKKDKRNAKAWLDGTPFDFTAETNDKLWKRDYLAMPTNTREIHGMLKFVAKNYASHVGIVEELHKLLKKPQVKRKLKEKIYSNNQTKITDFL